MLFLSRNPKNGAEQLTPKENQVPTAIGSEIRTEAKRISPKVNFKSEI
jgi:hypothetical protein